MDSTISGQGSEGSLECLWRQMLDSLSLSGWGKKNFLTPMIENQQASVIFHCSLFWIPHQGKPKCVFVYECVCVCTELRLSKVKASTFLGAKLNMEPRFHFKKGYKLFNNYIWKSLNTELNFMEVYKMLFVCMWVCVYGRPLVSWESN